jgi:hypothetical protein
MSDKAHPDINDTLRNEGPDAVRARHDRAWAHAGNGNGQDKNSRFQLKPFDEITLSTAPNYLVKGIIPRIGLAVIWGPPKCGKSFWTLDLAMHIALGREYRDHRVQQGAIVYLALEGGHGFRNRVEAWRQRHLAAGGGVSFMITRSQKDELRRLRYSNADIANMTHAQAHEILSPASAEQPEPHVGPVPFYLIDVPVDLAADRSELIQAIREQLGEQIPAAVVIDTLNRALLGDENKSDDMAKFIRAADMVRTTFGCVVIIIHHCGIAGGRPRGHTSLAGADDVQIAVARDEQGNITVTVEHMKDGDASAPMGSRLERVELGTDDDGDPITSCVIVPAEREAIAKPPELPPTAKLALEQLQELTAEAGQPAPASNHIPRDILVCPADLWRESFYKAYLGKRDTKKKAFNRAVTRLQELHLIGIWNENVWLRDKRDKRDIGGTSGQMSRGLL